MIRGGKTFDSIAKCNKIIFDKTGTLTTAKLDYCGSQLLEGEQLSEELVIAVAYGLEKHSSHPISESIVEFSNKKQIPPYEVENCQISPGYGVKGEVVINGNKCTVSIGLLNLYQRKICRKR